MISIDQISALQTWPLRQRIMWPDQSLDYIKLPKDDTGIHFGLSVNEELMSVISLFVEQGNAQFRKLATESSAQGKGVRYSFAYTFNKLLISSGNLPGLVQRQNR